MEDIADRLLRLKENLPSDVRLVAVSKTQPVERILEAYKAGQRIFGENKAQELLTKAPLLPSDIEWHFIGHLQTNKVKTVVPFAKMIHSIDSMRLLEEVAKEANRTARTIECLLQFHIAEEETKYGLSLEEAKDICSHDKFRKHPFLVLAGVMGMATLTENPMQISQEFSLLKDFFIELKRLYFSDNQHFKEISMGMSDDYLLAIAEGSTLIRLGSALFGYRNP